LYLVVVFSHFFAENPFYILFYFLYSMFVPYIVSVRSAGGGGFVPGQTGGEEGRAKRARTQPSAQAMFNQLATGAYPDTDSQYPDTDAQYPDTDSQYPDTDAQYPSTDAQYPGTQTQYPGMHSYSGALTAPSLQQPSVSNLVSNGITARAPDIAPSVFVGVAAVSKVPNSVGLALLGGYDDSDSD
jgi:hypothetical protein